MCGITGIVTKDVHQYEQELSAMTDLLRHRGPDDEGIHMFRNCGLGHRRLSIVDLRTGSQPMLSPSNSIGITFNGEIYGYKEIRAACLEYPFQTTSDTEVILALFAKYGKRFVSKLPGMFAFALWDDQEQQLICARDRFGEKPFYYAFGRNREFVFASEIKAIIGSGLVQPVLDKEALSFYLQRVYVGPHRTIYENIFTLPPAHMLCYRDGHLVIERYWELPQLNDEISLSEAEEEFRRLLNVAVAKQLIADVPVGAFLSGGLDSTTIVAYASQHKAKIETFSFGFEQFVNELPFARDVANLYHTEHKELYDSTLDIGELLLTMQQVYDEPFADSSNIPTYLISKLARQHTKVVLTGDGGDELLGGYTQWYRPLHLMEHMPSGMIPFYRIIAQIRPLLNKFNFQLSPSVQEAVNAQRLRRHYPSIVMAHYQETQYFSDEVLQRLELPSLKSDNSYYHRYNFNTLDDALRMDIENYMAGDILVKIDRASMAHGLELRAPFLDVDLASFLISLPSCLKVTSDVDKFLLRQACSTLWPVSIQKRGKMGFGGPIYKWLLQDSVKILVDDFLKNRQRKIFSLLDYKQCHQIIANNEVQTWILLVLSLWMETHQFSLSV